LDHVVSVNVLVSELATGVVGTRISLRLGPKVPKQQGDLHRSGRTTGTDTMNISNSHPEPKCWRSHCTAVTDVM